MKTWLTLRYWSVLLVETKIMRWSGLTVTVYTSPWCWSARWYKTTQKNPERRSLSLESGVAYLATILAKVSIEMGSFLHDVVRGDRLPASIILWIKGASAGFDARGTRSWTHFMAHWDCSVTLYDFFLHEVGKFSVLGEITLKRRSSSRMQDLTHYLFPYSHNGHSSTRSTN